MRTFDFRRCMVALWFAATAVVFRVSPCSANTIGNGEPLPYEADPAWVQAPAVAAAILVGAPAGILAAIACVPLRPFLHYDSWDCYFRIGGTVGYPPYLVVGAPLHYLRAAVVREPALPETYVAAKVDARGRLVITKASGKTVVIEKEGDQTSYDSPLVSKDGAAVAAEALFPNCCTSYDIPLELIVYAAGKTHRFKGTELPIFQWGFAEREGTIAYGQETVHFSCNTHYELRDIASERLLESIDVPQPCGEQPDPKPVEIPKWVERLRPRAQ